MVILLPKNSSSNQKKALINDYPNETEKEPIRDITQAKEFLKVLSGEIGTIVEQLLGSIYNLDVADQYADAIIKIYKRLLDEGLSEQTVERLVIEYSSNVDKFMAFLKKDSE